MKKIYCCIAFCIACGGNPFQSGEYVISYDDEIYGLGGASINNDLDNAETTITFDEYTTAENCAPLFQSVARTERVKIDVDAPSITEVDEDDSTFSLESNDCGSYESLYGLEIEDVFNCYYLEVKEGFDFVFEFHHQFASRSLATHHQFGDGLLGSRCTWLQLAACRRKCGAKEGGDHGQTKT